MFPPIYAVCSIVPAVTALIGTSPVRLYPFGDAPQNVALPYATWQVVTGSPANYIDSAPDVDRFGVQVDCWAGTVSAARSVAMALRDAIEPHAHIVAWRGEERDRETLHYRYSFDVDWFVSR
jgi:hypothetical protein